MYYWKDTLEKVEEYGLILKTQSSMVDAVVAEIKNLHSYDVPCIVTYPVEKGHPPFIDWVVAETSDKNAN
jgi:periplasmic divalent cation tolerance protein